LKLKPIVFYIKKLDSLQHISADLPPNKSKYKSLKVRLDKIIIPSDELDISSVIQDAVRRTNAITEKAYILIRLWLLHLYHTNIPLPIINEGLIKMAYKAIVQPTRGPKPKGDIGALENK